MANELKPCPFCESEDVELRAGVMFNGAVHCKNGQWVALDLPLGLKISRYISWDNIGKDVFFTEEQAEQKLKEMRGDTNA